MARPSLITANVIGRLCKAIRNGATYEQSCAFAGVHYTTFRRWMSNAEELLDKIQTLRAGAADTNPTLVIRDKSLMPLDIDDIIEAAREAEAALEVSDSDPDSDIELFGLSPSDVYDQVPEGFAAPAELEAEDADADEYPVPRFYDEETDNEIPIILSDWDRKTLWAYTMVKQAEGEAVNKWLEHIERAAESGSWQAAAWKLERRYPEDFGRKTHVRQEGKVEHDHVVVYLPDNERD